MLDELDLKILKGLYNLNFNHGQKLNFTELGFESNQHAAYHLYKLQKLSYINFDEERSFTKGGRKHEKYHNNVLTIWSENFNILEKGIEEVKKHF